MERLATTPGTYIDQVCGMKVVPGQTRLVTIYRGHSYWFCSRDCREAFEMNPRKYLERKPEKRKGWLGRYLDRMARANKDQFGGGGPKCH